MTTSPQTDTAAATSLPPTFTFGDLEIGFTMAFQSRGDSRGSTQEAVGFWRPVPAPGSGFYALGDLIFPGFEDANNSAWAATVKAAQTAATGTVALPPIAPPTGYEKVGNLVEMGPLANGEFMGYYWFWRPSPPEGYVSLGLLIGDPNSDNPPTTDLVMCVRSNLVVLAGINPKIVFSGHSDEHLARLWTTSPQQAPPGLLYFNPGTFIGWNSESLSPPPSDPSAYSLILNAVDQPKQQQTTPPTPVLAGPWRPEQQTESVAYRVTLPWFAVTDPGMKSSVQLEKSPNYYLERVDTYTCVGFGNNATTVPQQQGVSWSTGTTGEQSKTFSETTGIEISAGSKELGFSVKLTQSFTYTTESSSGWSKDTTASEQTTVPPDTAIAVFAITSAYNLFRSDGSLVSGGVEYTADNSTMCWAQYPPVKSDASPSPGTGLSSPPGRPAG